MYRKERSKKQKLPTGVYTSTVIEVDFDPEYMNEEAFFIRYKMVDENGVEYEHRELFFNTEDNERTAELFEYLECNGISLDAIKTFEGCHEKLTFKKTVKNNRSQLVIAMREFLGYSEEETA